MSNEAPPTLTRAVLADAVRAQVDLPREQCRRLVDDVFLQIEGALLTGERVKLAGFGAFEVRTKHARPGRNLHTMEDVTISARRVAIFRPSRVLRDAMNADRDR